MPPSLFTAVTNTSYDANTHASDSNRKYLQSILSKTITDIVGTSKIHLVSAIVENDKEPPNTQEPGSTTDSNPDPEYTKDTIPEIMLTDKQSLEYRRALANHLQTFMNKLHEYQTFIYIQQMQAMDIGSIFDESNLTSSAASNAAPATSISTNLDTSNPKFATAPALNMAIPNIPGIRSPPPIPHYTTQHGRCNVGASNGGVNGNDYIRQRAAEAGRERAARLEQTDSDYARALQMAEDEKRRQSWTEWRNRQYGANRGPYNPGNDHSPSNQSMSASINFHEEQQRKWNSNGFNIWDNVTSASSNGEEVPPPYKYYDHNTGTTKYNDGPTDTVTTDDIWADVDGTHRNGNNGSLNSPIYDRRRHNPGTYHSTALEHFGAELLDINPSSGSNSPVLSYSDDFDQDFDQDFEDENDNNNDDGSMVYSHSAVGDYGAYVRDYIKVNHKPVDITSITDRNNGGYASDNDDGDDDEMVQCCGRIGYDEHNIAEKPETFLARYPHNVYISNSGVVVGNPCGNQIPADKFYNERKVLCNRCVESGVDKITEPAKEFAPMTGPTEGGMAYIAQ